MNMAKILNTLFSTIGIFFLCFLWIVYCTKNSMLAFALSSIVALSAAYLIFNGQKAFDNRKKIKNSEKKKIFSLGETLRFGEDNASLIADMLRYYRFEAEKIDFDNLIAIKKERTFVAIRMTADSITRESLATAVATAKRNDCRKLFLFAHKADKSLIASASQAIPITFIDVANLYVLLEQSGKLPDLTFKKTYNGVHFVAKYALCRKRFFWYLATSLFMSALTIVSYIKWYTLIWATITFAIAIYCLVNRRYNVQPTAVSLE